MLAVFAYLLCCFMHKINYLRRFMKKYLIYKPLYRIYNLCLFVISITYKLYFSNAGTGPKNRYLEPF